MKPRQVILARPLLPQNQTSRPRRKGLDLTARIKEGIEAAGRGALRPGSRKPDPRCGRACPGCVAETLTDPVRSPYQPSRADARWLAKANRPPLPWWPRILGTDVSVSCSCGLLHRAATQMPCCNDLCSVYSRF